TKFCEAEQSWKIKFGWKSLQGSGIVKFQLVSLDRGWILVQRSVKPKNQSRRVNFCIMYWGVVAFFASFFLKKKIGQDLF
ncbi:MAG: hypothetical protein U9Q73_02460, partial [Nanoarchaeota archaeon]|nr:hypothetical protein [Nanoarchaeota archaeon]